MDVSRLHRRLGVAGRFDMALVLGSGLAAAAEGWEALGSVPFAEIEGLPDRQIEGHPGRLLAVELGGWRLLVFQGRFHLYQGYRAWEAASPVRLAHRLGCRRLLLTCAAGGLHPHLGTGDLLWVRDHLNLLGDNPLRGLHPPSFLDLSRLYDQSALPALAAECRSRGVRLHSGVLAALPGPSYETPAEVTALGRLGADAVSMSTVPEAIMAGHLGMQVAALAFIANPAAGLQPDPLDHAEVLSAGRRGAAAVHDLVEALVRQWRKPAGGLEARPQDNEITG